MNTIVIDKKNMSSLSKRSTINYWRKVASKKPAARTLTLEEGKKLAYKLIDRWHKEK